MTAATTIHRDRERRFSSFEAAATAAANVVRTERRLKRQNAMHRAAPVYVRDADGMVYEHRGQFMVPMK
jgi:hypothetical protein